MGWTGRFDAPKTLGHLKIEKSIEKRHLLLIEKRHLLLII
jgi:hypothetical protein